MPYLNVDEVEAAIGLAAASNPGVAELVQLPQPDVGGADLSRDPGPSGRGGRRGRVPARRGPRPRMGQPGHLDQLRAAADRRLPHRHRHHARAGMSLDAAEGSRESSTTWTSSCFPQANPDGRHHSMTVDPMWRKNRRPAEHGAPRLPGRRRQRARRGHQPQLRLPVGLPDEVQPGCPGDDLDRSVQRDLPRAVGRVRAGDRRM